MLPAQKRQVESSNRRGKYLAGIQTLMRLSCSCQEPNCFQSILPLNNYNLAGGDAVKLGVWYQRLLKSGWISAPRAE